jgi:Flp pilus assembly protein TadG
MRKSRNLGDASCDTQTAALTRDVRRRKSRGQSLAEFAVLLPVLTLVLALSADFGRAFTAYIAISSAAREGASYAMASTAQANDADAVRAAALADAPTIWGRAPVVSAPVITKDAQNYDMVSVTVTYTFDTIMPIPPIPNSITMDRTVSMRIIN